MSTKAMSWKYVYVLKGAQSLQIFILYYVAGSVLSTWYFYLLTYLHNCESEVLLLPLASFYSWGIQDSVFK